ncbi:MAG: dockerin type I repeat-containing protein [Planctomycetota bacterium]
MFRIAVISLVGLLAAPVGAQSFEFAAPVQEIQISPSEAETVVVGFTIAQIEGVLAETQGFAMGVAHDPAMLTVDSIDYGAGVISDQWGEPDIFITNAHVGGWTCGVVFAHLGNWTVEFPVPLAAIDITYSVDPALPLPSEAELTWSSQLGTPPVSNVIVVSGASLSVALADGALSFVPVSFIRGDMNGDGGINIADIFTAEEYLFLGGDTPGCLAALDSNGDGAIDIGDIIYELSYLFLGGDPMPAPFPACGPLTEDSEVGCEESQCTS